MITSGPLPLMGALQKLTKPQTKCATCIGKVYRNVIMRRCEILLGCCNEVPSVATLLYCKKCKEYSLDLRTI